MAHKIGEDLIAGGRRQVERQRSLPPVEGLEEQAVLAVGERRHVPADVATAARILDLDDLRAKVGEVQRSEGARPVLLDGDDPQVGQRRSAHQVPFSVSVQPVSARTLNIRCFVCNHVVRWTRGILQG